MGKKDVFGRWKSRGIKFKILTGAIIVLGITVLPLPLLAVFVMLVTHTNFISVWSSALLYGLYAAAMLGIILFALFEYRTLEIGRAHV